MKWICNKEYERLIKAEEALLRVFFLDKTKPYGYDRKSKDRNQEGYLPKPGSRWLTPREAVHEYFKGDFWSKYNKFLQEYHSESEF